MQHKQDKQFTLMTNLITIHADRSVESGSVKIFDFGFTGLLLYIFVFYTQIAHRFPFLSPLRLEFVIGAVLVALAVFRFSTGSLNLTENFLNIAALLFITIALFTIPFAFVRSHALETFIRLLKFFSIYLMIVAFVDNEKKLKIFFYSYLALIAFLFLQPFFLSLYGKGFIFNNHMYRLAGVTPYFGHPNQLGGITAANLPFFYYMFKNAKRYSLKILYFSILLAAIRVIMLTQSRTAFLGTATFFLMLLLFSKQKVKTFAILILAAVMIWSFSPDVTRDRFLTLFKISYVMSTERQSLSYDEVEELGSIASRLELNRRTFIVFLENPILGVGLNCFMSVNGQRWGYWFPPHNTYLQALAEMGILGFSAFILVIYQIFKNITSLKRLAKEHSRDSLLEIISLSLLIYLIIRLSVSMFGMELYDNYWWVAGGTSMVALRIYTNKYGETIKD